MRPGQRWARRRPQFVNPASGWGLLIAIIWETPLDLAFVQNRHEPKYALGSYQKCLHILGPGPTCFDAFRCVWMRLDMFGYIRKRLAVFWHFWIFVSDVVWFRKFFGCVWISMAKGRQSNAILGSKTWLRWYVWRRSSCHQVNCRALLLCIPQRTSQELIPEAGLSGKFG